MLNIFECALQDRKEVRLCMLLVALLERLTPEQRSLWLPSIPLGELKGTLRAEVQLIPSGAVPQALLVWPGELAMSLEIDVSKPDYIHPHNLHHSFEPHRDLLIDTVSGRGAPRHVAMLVAIDRRAALDATWGRFDYRRTKPAPAIEAVLLTWQQLADGAVALSRQLQDSAGASLERKLLAAFAGLLYKEGLAVRPLDPINVDILRNLLPGLHQLKVLRRHLEHWMGHLRAQLPAQDKWKQQTRFDDWVDLSVVLTRELKLISEERWGPSVHWQIEVFGPVREELIGEAWPETSERGLGIRVGFRLSDEKHVEAYLPKFKVSLEGAPYSPETSLRAWVSPNKTRGEVFCYTSFDPEEACKAAQWVIQTLAVQLEGETASLIEEEVLKDWHQINAFKTAGELSLACTYEGREDDPELLPLWGDEEAEHLRGKQTSKEPARSHSGKLLPYTWTSRKGYCYTDKRWSCCGQRQTVEGCGRTPGRHHPGELFGWGSRSGGGGGAAAWTCCREGALSPGCTEGDGPSELNEG